MRALIDDARTWLRDTAAKAGRHVDVNDDAIEPVHARPWSSVLRAPTRDGGALFLKMCAPSQAQEPALTTLLAREMPSLLPDVIAVHPQRAWMLLDDGGVRVRDAFDGQRALDAWIDVLPRYAELQRAFSGRLDELRATRIPERALDRLVADLDVVLNDDRVLVDAIFDSDARRRLGALLPAIDARCAELSAAGIGVTVQHDDLHDGNLMTRGSSLRVFDWGDASITHPLLSLGTLVEHSARRAGVPETHASIERVRDAYLEAWSASLPRTALLEAAAIATSASTITRALTWHRILTLDDDVAARYPKTLAEFVGKVLAAFST